MRIAQVFAHAIVRRLAYVLVAVLLAWCGMGKAHAQSGPPTMCRSTQLDTACSEGVAFSACMGEGLTQLRFAVGANPPKEFRNEECYLSNTFGPNFKAYRPRLEYRNVGSTGAYSSIVSNYEYWFKTSSSCPGGVDPESPTGCKPTTEECLARNTGLSNQASVRNYANACVASCTLKATGPTVGVDGLFTGFYQYSGDVCTAGPTLPGVPRADENKNPPQECTPAGGGMTFCLKPDGQQCYTSSTGRQNCWRVGETGEKDDGAVKQKRDAGTEAIPPNLQLPSGDNLQQSSTPKTQTTTVTNNNTTTTVTTTTTNYTTQHGTNAGSQNSGESNTGDGSGKEDDGDTDGTASGGGDCKTPPITTGDPVLGMVAAQAWHTRCAVEAGNAVKVTGDVGNCAQPFVVEGTHANAEQLRAMRAAICGGDTNGNKRPDWTETNGTETPAPGEGGDEPGLLAKTFSLDNLDGSGFLGGAGTCPQMGVVDLSFTQVDLSTAAWWCPFVSMCRAILLLMGAFISIRLLME